MCSSSDTDLTSPLPEPIDIPSKREKSAQEIRRPEGQRERQELAAKLGVQQLRAPLLNVPS